MIQSVSRLFGRAFGTLVVLALTGIVIAIVAVLMVARFVEHVPTLQEPLRCMVFPTDDCANVRERQLRKELAETQADQKALQALIARLQGLEDRYKDFALFAESPLPGKPDVTVTTGVRYASILADTWKFAWCYASLSNNEGTNTTLAIADASPAGGITLKSPTGDALGAIGLTMADIRKAQSLCRFPGEASA